MAVFSDVPILIVSLNCDSKFFTLIDCLIDYFILPSHFR